MLKRLELRSGRPPAELTSFVGRHEELAEIVRLLDRCRLVTLTGPGGVGKTRLSLRAAARLGGSFEDGVAFADLSALHEPGLLTQTIGETLGLHDQNPSTALDALVHHLADRDLLLVLDTCEHLVDACAMLAEVLLQNARGLRIVATSRQPLDIPGEHTLVVAPLKRPEPGGYVPGLPCDSMTLFAERAAAVVPGWTITDGNQAAVALLCHRLDGIPLAIELAAVQLRALSVEQIVDRLDRRILQVRGRRSGLPRHQTLRAAVDWSHELCSPDERLLWARLSVFTADFCLDSAEQVCSDAELPAERIFELIAGLVAKSVVLRVEREGAVRYRMLDIMREYGAERLEEAGETEAVRARAFDRLAAAILEAAAGLSGAAQPRWLAWFRREQAGVRDMIDYGLRRADDELLVALMLGLGRLLALQGLIGEARHWALRVIDGREHGPGPGWTETLALAGLLAAMQDDLGPCRDLLRRAEERAVAENDLRGLGYVREVSGVAAFCADDLDLATRCLEEARGLHGRAGTADVLVPITDVFLSVARTMAGDPAAAVRYASEAVRVTEAAGEHWCRSYGLCARGLATLMSGDAEGALPDLRAGLRIKRDLDDRLGVSLALDIVGICLIGLGDAVRGVRLLAAADWTRDYTGTSMFGPQHALLRDAYKAQARETLGEAPFQAAYDAGTALDFETAVAEGLGETPVPPTALDRPAEPAAEPAPELTPRENEIAGLVAEGLTNRQIAERLVIAKRTVDSHLEHILAKLGFTSRAQIAAWFTALNAIPAQRPSPDDCI
ncbi:ATP-binding protein [Actinomadura rubrisoli]|uniref:LuxR family transcriptional regulator n=1 Tax=Actinomadura rubrisoli TaxID=2530368 RepID=A0A4R5BLE3_9ACTN|nr:LuxR C-terminal-related transcriptional regulator [Actinomadura rubrisoli]TDD86569.1 LuxR family transcriptional regulator [Actinomadura rubrisoli]